MTWGERFVSDGLCFTVGVVLGELGALWWTGQLDLLTGLLP